MRPSSAFVEKLDDVGFSVYAYLNSPEEIPLMNLEVINQPC